ncbi:TPA_asm: VOC family protein, partial [Salmonella enterica subsp. enterica serovar Enteritidis str. P125109]|nr:VOC family protein [Salmonella enterica subsp. enterica serovar Enteritidis str. P125109]
GGKIIMPIQKTFWSEAYGIVEDAFGVQWQVNHETSMG